MKKPFILSSLLFLVGCSYDEKTFENLTEDGEIAKAYLEEQGFEVVGYNGESVLRFKEADFETGSFEGKFWTVQPVKPDAYYDKSLPYISFIVKNHPFDEQSKKQQTSVNVLLHDKKVIGGTSFPDIKAGVGGVHSLSGKCVETSKVGYGNPQATMNKEMPEDFNFSLIYGTYGKKQIDTFNDVVVKDLVADGTIEANIALTKEEKQAIYNEMLKMNIMGDLDLNKGKECMVEPPSRTEWVIQINGETKKISYNSYCDYPPDVLNLIKLQDFIHSLVSSKKEYLDLPASNGYYE